MILNFAPFMFGGMLSTQEVPNGNMVGATATALAIMDRVGLNTNSEYTEMSQAIQGYIQGPKCYRDSVRSEECAIDDYIALLAYDGAFAAEFLGSDPTNPLWRVNGVFPTAKYSAARDPGILGKIQFYASIQLCISKSFTVQDSWMQTALMILAYERSGYKSARIDHVIDDWKSKLRQNAYTMRRIFVEYSGYPDHPLAELFGMLDNEWKL